MNARQFILLNEDMNGVQMYSNAGGIQVLAKLSGGTFAPVPRDELFASEERNIAAVNIALGSLVTNPRLIEAHEKKL